MSQDVPLVQMQIEGRWVDADATPLMLANQLIAQVFQGNVVLTFGQVAPPVLKGTPQQQAEQAREIDSLSIHALARFVVPPAAFQEMAAAFTSTLSVLKAHGALADLHAVEDSEREP